MFKNILKHYKAAYSGLSREAWLLGWTMLINRSGSMVLFFIMLYLTTELHISLESAGRIFSLFGLGAMGGSFLGGYLSDKYGTKKVQLFSLVFGGIGYIILGYVQSPLLIGLMLFIIALVSESFRPASTTAMANACPPETRMRGFALNRLAINLGVSIGPTIGGFLALYDYIYLFWVQGLTSIAAAIFLFVMFHEPIESETTIQGGVQIKIISPIRDIIYLQLLIIMLAIGITFNQLFNTWPVYLKESYQLREDNIGILLALNAIIIVLFEMPLIHRLGQDNLLRKMMIGSVLLCSGFGAILFFNSFTYAAFTVLIWSVGEMLVFPLLVTFIANRAHQKNRGSYMGMMTFTFSFSFVLGPLFGSWIYFNLGPSFLWFLLIFLSFLMIPGFLFLERNIKRVAGKNKLVFE